jgi:hypothetical protein
VPQLCAELDQTTEQRMLRRLGFALRAIGDARAVPALVRAIPKTLQPPLSDYGLVVDNNELAAFMREHDLDGGQGRGTSFGFGRPVREIFGALQKLTNQDFGDEVLFSVVVSSDDPRAQSMQRRLYFEQAQRWQEWWESHAKELTNDAAYHRVGLVIPEEVPQSVPLSHSPNAKLGEKFVGVTLSTPIERGASFLDLDTGVKPPWPNDWAHDVEIEGRPEVAQWAAENGIDLMCVTYKSPTGESTYALRAFNMRLWELAPADARNIEKRLKSGKLAGQPAGELLLHYDRETKQYAPDQNAEFLYMTREGGMGLLEVTDRVTRVEDLTGRFDTPKGVGFTKGVRFNYTPIKP